MQNTYWNKQGKHQAEYERLVELMPASGKCDTVAGELIRAATRLAYDLYNNGMGNNTSGAANFLLMHCAIDDATHSTIYEYTRGRLYGGHYQGDALQVAVERTIDRVVEFILARPELEHEPNTQDMFDYEEPFQNFCEECDDEVDGWGLYGRLCSFCEEHMWEDEEDEEELEY